MIRKGRDQAPGYAFRRAAMNVAVPIAQPLCKPTTGATHQTVKDVLAENILWAALEHGISRLWEHESPCAHRKRLLGLLKKGGHPFNATTDHRHSQASSHAPSSPGQPTCQAEMPIRQPHVDDRIRRVKVAQNALRGVVDDGNRSFPAGHGSANAPKGPGTASVSSPHHHAAGECLHLHAEGDKVPLPPHKALFDNVMPVLIAQPCKHVQRGCVQYY